MKRYSVLIICFTLLLLQDLFAQPLFPVHLGGFALGDDISLHRHLLDPETRQTLPLQPYMEEYRVVDRPGIKSGTIAYGSCERKGKILRIKLKFEDSSKKFFKKLKKKYEKKLGSPGEYKGDPFQTVIAWKWSFENDRNEKISLILQHNTMKEDEKIGTAVKLTLTSEVEKEKACYRKKHTGSKKKNRGSKKAEKIDWNLLIPY